MKDTYYIIHRGRVFLREYVGWKNAYKAAKRLHSKAFIISKSWHERKKKQKADRARWAAAARYDKRNDMVDAFAYAMQGMKLNQQSI